MSLLQKLGVLFFTVFCVMKMLLIIRLCPVGLQFDSKINKRIELLEFSVFSCESAQSAHGCLVLTVCGIWKVILVFIIY